MRLVNSGTFPIRFSFEIGRKTSAAFPIQFFTSLEEIPFILDLPFQFFIQLVALLH